MVHQSRRLARSSEELKKSERPKRLSLRVRQSWSGDSMGAVWSNGEVAEGRRGAVEEANSLERQSQGVGVRLRAVLSAVSARVAPKSARGH